MATHRTSGMPAHPYLDWAIASGFAYLRPGEWLPLLVEFEAQLTRRQFTTLGWLDDRLKSDVWVPDLFRGLPHPAFEVPEFNFCVLLIRKSGADAVVRDSSWQKAILRAELGPPGDRFDLGEFPMPPAEPADTQVEWQYRTVLAVIDEGISFAHPRFRKMSGATRVEYVWRQDAGIELTAAQIDAEVVAAKAAGEGEDKVYRAIGGLDMHLEGYKPLARRHAHGTHVLDLASGYGPSAAPPPRPAIIAVDMPEGAVGDPAGSTLTTHATLGLYYVWLRAMSLRRPQETLPVVVNISYGPHEGPHDGSSLFERFVDMLTLLSRQTHTPMRVVLAAGNFRQSRAHACFELRPGAPQKLAWRVQPCGLTPSFMEIWFPANADVTVTLTPPSGAPLLLSTSTAVPNSPVPKPSPPAWISFAVPGTALSCIVLCLAPTAEDPWALAPHPVAPSGIWSVEIKNDSNTTVGFDAWIKRSDTPGGRRAKGRQSYFDDRAYLRFDTCTRPQEFDLPGSYVQRRGTLSGIATGCETFVIGAYRRGPDRNDQMPAAYSSEASASPIPGRDMKAPNWLAPGEDACSCPGALGAGTRSGARVAMNGTSAAAPQVARFFAEHWDGTLPGPVPVLIDPPSSRVPVADRPLVAGDGLLRMKPPVGRVWKDRP